MFSRLKQLSNAPTDTPDGEPATVGNSAKHVWAMVADGGASAASVVTETAKQAVDAAASGVNHATETATAGASQFAEAASSAVRRAVEAPKELVVGAVKSATEAATRRVQQLIEKILQIAFFFCGTVSLYFIGLFTSVGIEFFSVIDKQSMLGSIFLLTCLFTSIRVLVSVVPTFLQSEHGSKQVASGKWSERFSAAGRYLSWLVVFGAFLGIVIGPEFAGAFILIAAVSAWTLRNRRLATKFIAALLACFCLGVLRGEHLRSLEPTLILHEQGVDKPLPIVVIMSADRGLLVFVDRAPTARFVPWERINRLDDSRMPWFRLRMP